MRKGLSILAAIALLGASTAAAAQTARPATAPEPAAETISMAGVNALDNEATTGVIFGLLTIVILIWLLGSNNDDELVPASP